MSRSISDRTVSTANNGMPCAWPAIAAGPPLASRHQCLEQRVHRPPVQWVEGERGPVAAGRPARAAGSSSGRANTRTKIGTSRAQSTRWSRNSNRPASAYCRSSISNTTGSVAASRSKNNRHPAKSSCGPVRGRRRRTPGPPAIGPAARRRTPARPDRGGTAPASSPSLPAATSVESSSAMPRRWRTICGQRPEHHPIAVGQAPAAVPPHAGRPARRRTSRTPSPTATCRPRPARTPPPAAASAGPRGVEQLLDQPQLGVAARAGAPRARRPAARRPHRPTPVSPPTAAPARLLPFSSCSPQSANPTAAARQPVGRLVHPDLPGVAAACTRAAVFTHRPRPFPGRWPEGHRNLTGHDPGPGCQGRRPRPRAQRRHGVDAVRAPARTARSASSSPATGVPHTAITASPMNFSTTPPYRTITVRAMSK